MRRPHKVYLGGPDVFLTDAAAFAHRKVQLAARYGFEGLSPAATLPAPSFVGERIDTLLFRANARLLREADCGIFNLTPFRGPSADAGTVFELGMMIGLGKPAFAYSNEPADLLSRTRDAVTVTFDAASGTWRDADGMEVEDFGNGDNLMIDRALAEQGWPMLRPAAAPPDRLRDLGGFERCLRLAAQAFAANAD